MEDCPTPVPWVPQVSLLRPGKARTSTLLFTLGLLATALTGCRPHDFPEYPPNYREYAYVPNGGSATVTILDVVNVRVDRELPVGENSVAVAASPTRNEVYVVNSGAAGGVGSVSVIDAERNVVAATIPVGRQPVSIDVDPKGKLAYVADSGSNFVSVLDLTTRREVARIGTGEEPVAAVLAPDGETLVVANRRANSVTLIDPASRQVRSVFEGCPGAEGPVILPDSSKAFVACSAGHQVMAIALAQKDDGPAEAGAAGEARKTPAWPRQPDQLEALMDVGRAPVDLALKPDGGEIFVSNSLSDSVSEIYDTTDEVGDTYMIGDDPVLGLVSRDNALLYVANLRSQYVTVYSIDDGKRVGAVHVGDGPAAMAFSGAGHLLFVVDSRSDDVAVVRVASDSLFTMLPAGRDPDAIVVKAFKVQ
ncbi:MAG: YncE family protein [Terracidiphilus sp.]